MKKEPAKKKVAIKVEKNIGDLKSRRNLRKKIISKNNDTKKWLEETLEQITELELSQRPSAILQPCISPPKIQDIEDELDEKE